LLGLTVVFYFSTWKHAKKIVELMKNE